MLPYILAAVGGYLIGDSMKKQYAQGGYMAKGGMVDYSKDGYVKAIRDLDGKLLKEIDIEGEKYIYNSAYKTYNSVKNNELLHKSKYEKVKKYTEDTDGDYADGGYMARGGNVVKNRMWKEEWTDTKGVDGFDVLKIIDTDYRGGKVVKSEIVESSKPERVGKMQEDSKQELRKIFAGKYPFAYRMVKKEDVVILGVPRNKITEKEWASILGMAKHLNRATFILKDEKGLDVSPQIEYEWYVKLHDGGMMAKGGKIKKLYAILVSPMGEMIADVEVTDTDEKKAREKFREMGITQSGSIRFSNNQPYYYEQGGIMADGGLIKISLSKINDRDFSSLRNIFESNDATFFIDKSEKYVKMDLNELPKEKKMIVTDIISKYQLNN